MEFGRVSRAGVGVMRTGSATAGRLARLIRLIRVLHVARYPSADELAGRVGVSRRTIHRDLEILGRAGVVVRYRPEYLGYEFLTASGFDPPRCEGDEILALIVLAGAGAEGAALQAAGARGAAKLAGALAEPGRSRLLELQGRISSEGVCPADPARQAVWEAVLDAFVRNVSVRIGYRGADRDGPGSTRLDPYHLRREAAGWIVIGRSSHHRAVRAFPLARIDRAWPTDSPFVVPPRFDPRRFAG